MKLNIETWRFELESTSALPDGFTEVLSVHAWENGERLYVLAGVPSSLYSRPPEDAYTSDFYAYDGGGIYRGSLNKVGLYRFAYPERLSGPCLENKLFSPSISEVYLNYMSTSWMKNGLGEKIGLIAGAWFGAISSYMYNGEENILLKRRYIINRTGDPIRHPGQEASPLVYSNASGIYSDILASGMGGAYYYKFTGEFSGNNPVYEEPVHVWQTEADLSVGAFATPTVFDWDGDGVLDIIAGSAQGYIDFFKNVGTNDYPLFQEGIHLNAGKREIHIQPGYGESNYGPEYVRCGFTGVNVVDWDGDGLPDILVNDGRGRHTVFLGVQENNGIRLAKGCPLYLKGLELRGTWRCRPGVGMLENSMAYVTLDDDDDLHLYWKMDAYNVTDGGKLYLRSLKKISGNCFKSTGTGRLKIDLVDWDGDGKIDILIGAAANSSVPDANTGVPYNRQEGGTGSSVIFLKNVNTNQSPMFENPVELKYKGHYIQLGENECSPSATTLGGVEGDLLNLLLGSDDGRFYLLKRSDISQ